ncbi:MAG: hypothetical protein G01um10147_1116 [Microgenomates group bacterium Gr01-1014_7]|nr:MAG: hypothetical protein G01um10147_1116 [Microgenomates group bacterium Gr01-1014_7]
MKKNILQFLILLSAMFFLLANPNKASAAELLINNVPGNSSGISVIGPYFDDRGNFTEDRSIRIGTDNCRTIYNVDWHNRCLAPSEQHPYTVTSNLPGNTIERVEDCYGNPINPPSNSINVTLSGPNTIGCLTFYWRAPRGQQCSPTGCLQPPGCPLPPQCTPPPSLCPGRPGCPPPPFRIPTPTPAPRTTVTPIPTPTPTPTPLPQFPDLVPLPTVNGQIIPNLVFPHLLRDLSNLTRLTTNSFTPGGWVYNIGGSDVGIASAAQMAIAYNVDPQNFNPTWTIPFPGQPQPVQAIPHILYSLAGTITSSPFVPVSWPAISNIPPGLHVFVVCADVGNLVPESIGEANNCNAGLFYYAPPAAGEFTISQPVAASCQQGVPAPQVGPITWTASAGAQTYQVYRIRPGSDTWEYLTPTGLPAGVLSYTDTAAVENSAIYYYTVGAYNSTGQPTWPSNNPYYVTVTTPSCQPPTNVSLSITNFNPSSDFQNGAARTSGRTTDQGGSNWNNPVNVVLSANPSSSQTIRKFQVEFVPPDGQSFTLKYIDNVPFVNDIPISTRQAPLNLEPILGGNVSVAPLLPRTPNTNTAGWYVFFDERFGSNVMDTRVYVQDSNQLCRSGNQTTVCKATEIQPN